MTPEEKMRQKGKQQKRKMTPNPSYPTGRDGFESRFRECESNRVVQVRMRVESSWELRMRVESENCELRINLRVEDKNWAIFTGFFAILQKF